MAVLRKAKKSFSCHSRIDKKIINGTKKEYQKLYAENIRYRNKLKQ